MNNKFPMTLDLENCTITFDSLSQMRTYLEKHLTKDYDVYNIFEWFLRCTNYYDLEK